MRLSLFMLIALTGLGCVDRAPTGAPVEPAPEEVTVTAHDAALQPKLEAYVEARFGELDSIPDERRARLDEIAAYVSNRASAGRAAELVFICTHNSRRSHMAQIWAQTAAAVYGIDNVATFSGGTEATAFNPRAVASLQRAGFLIEPFTDGKNPVYEVRCQSEMEPMQAFSKVYDSPPNPTEGFAAVMTCAAADEACPLVHGAAERIAVPYDDPKDFDGTEREAEMYDERGRQIAREMLYVFSKV